MTKLLLTYSFEIDGGELPDEAVRELVAGGERREHDWTSWELGGPEFVSCEVIPKKESK